MAFIEPFQTALQLQSEKPTKKVRPFSDLPRRVLEGPSMPALFGSGSPKTAIAARQNGFSPAPPNIDLRSARARRSSARARWTCAGKIAVLRGQHGVACAGKMESCAGKTPFCAGNGRRPRGNMEASAALLPPPPAPRGVDRLVPRSAGRWGPRVSLTSPSRERGGPNARSLAARPACRRCRGLVQGSRARKLAASSAARRRCVRVESRGARGAPESL